MSSYSPNTLRRAAKILGYNIDSIEGAREFSVINCIVYTDLFTGDVTIDGYTGSITKAFNGKVGGTTYYNQLILDPTLLETVSLTLTWGDDGFIQEIYELLDYLEENTFNIDNADVSSKKIEDFSVSYKSSDESEKSKMSVLEDSFSFYIRKPVIILPSKEQRNDWRYF